MRKFKIFTIIDRLNWFSDIWIEYHLRYFKKSEIAFLNDKKFLNDDSLKRYLIENFSFNEDEIHIIHSEDQPTSLRERHVYITHFINMTQSNLLLENDVVIYLDIDELIYHPDLVNLLNTFDSDYLVTNPMDILHNINIEYDFDFSKPINSQRNYINSGIISGWYKKNIIVRNKTYWQDGRHTNEMPTISDLYLIHLGKIDLKFTNLLNKQNREMRGWEESQNAFIDNELEDWFRNFTISEIPEYIKVALNGL